jgi:IclR family acetate operon transcriptional repressor
VLASDLIVYLEKVDSPHPVRMFSRVGGVNPAVRTAIGRAILAHSPDDVVGSALSSSSSQRLGQEIPPATFAKVLEEVRRTGFSTDLEDNEPSICCVGAPIFDHVGRVTGAISVSTPASRFRRKHLPELARIVRAGADEISTALGWDPTHAPDWARGNEA